MLQGPSAGAISHAAATVRQAVPSQPHSLQPVSADALLQAYGTAQSRAHMQVTDDPGKDPGHNVHAKGSMKHGVQRSAHEVRDCKGR